MYFDDESVGSDCRGGYGEGMNEACDACCMRGVYDDGEMRELMQEGYDGEVDRIACCRLEGADAALAEDDVGVARCHDVFGAHEELLQC